MIAAKAALDHLVVCLGIEEVVRRVGCHEELLEACRAGLLHLTELREAWERGCLSERDGGGGTRSNRNLDLEAQLRAAIAKATHGE